MPSKPSALRRFWNALSGRGPGIDDALEAPADIAENTRTRVLRKQAKYDFTRATTYPHKVLTKHGRAIIPYRVTASGHGIASNVFEFGAQPRVRELSAQMAPLLKSRRDDGLMLDESSGRFYLKSDIDAHGVKPERALGEIDMKTEIMLFNHAAQMTAMRRMFGDARPDNPIVLEEGTGKVYPKNNPDDVRGHVQLGSTVHMSAARPRRR